MEIKERLLKIASQLEKCNCLADIGTDHAYIPVYAIKNGLCKKAIASDIGVGPLKTAKKNVDLYGYKNSIELRLGNGLETLNPNEADTIVIAGMGGTLIVELLNKSIEIAKNAKLILQPMNYVEKLREFLFLNGYKFIDEDLVQDGRKLYVIITVIWTGKVENFSAEDCYINYNLLKDNPAFPKYIEKQISRSKEILIGLNLAEEKDINAIKFQENLLERLCKLREKNIANLL